MRGFSVGAIAATATAAAAFAGHPARAQVPDAANPPGQTLNEADEEQFLVGTVAPRNGSAALVASGFGGYDSALRSAVVGGSTEVAVTRWLAVRAGFVFVPQGTEDAGNARTDASNGLRANLGVRAQFLRQESAGLDGAVAFNYRQDRFAEDGGLIEGVLAAGHRSDSLQLLANLAYAQDPEGDDYEGELRGAALYRVAQPFNLGVQASYRRDLGSTDARRASRSNPDNALVAGPVATYGLHNFLLLLHAGLSRSQRQAETQNGAFVLGGVGAAF